MSVSFIPARPPTSGAAATASDRLVAARGADMGFTGSAGFGGACADEAIVITPARFSCGEISGAARFAVVSEARFTGRREVNSFAVSCSFGRSGWALANCTMLGSAGKILGGSSGAFG